MPCSHLSKEQGLEHGVGPGKPLGFWKVAPASHLPAMCVPSLPAEPCAQCTACTSNTEPESYSRDMGELVVSTDINLTRLSLT